jgi:ribonuclease P protein component
VLPAAHRLTDQTSFRAVVRSGRRAASRTLVVHAGELGPGPRVGLVVSKAVGNAVTRNRVQRRLRHLVREQLDSLPASTALVIRALPPAATADSTELRDDLVRCLRRATREVPAS